MVTSPDPITTTGYEPWLQAVQALLAFQWKLLEVQCQAGVNVLEGAFRSVANCSSQEKPALPDDLAQLEQLAAARISQGFAPPREIYQLPYRNRIDWARFPEWARPSDPELFEGSAHEG